MTTSPLFKKISVIFITVFICFIVFSLPKRSDAALASSDVGGFATEYSGWDSEDNEPYTSTGNTLYEWMSESQYASQRKNPDNETPAAISARVHGEIYTLMNAARTTYNEAYTNAKIRTQSEDAEWNGYIDEWQLDVTDENKKYAIAYTEAAIALYTYQKSVLDKYGFAGDDADASEINNRLRMNKEVLREIRAYEASHNGSIKGFRLDQNLLNDGLEILDPSGNVVGTVNDSGEIFCWKGLPSPAIDPQGCIALGLYYGLLKPSSWVLWASGVAFNFSIDLTLNFGKFIRDQGLGTSGSGAIYLGWSAIRDLINVGFIFILLYAAVSTIVGLDGYGVKQTIVKVVIAALLLNFSLFFTKALIDMSNLIALQFYTRVLSAADRANSGSNLSLAGENVSGSWDKGLSIGFVNALGLKSIWASKDNQSGNQAGSAFGSINAGQLIIICLGGSAFILVTAFTLFMATLRFLYRSIVLIFLMILSPVGFVGSAIPALKGAASKWQSRLKNNLIFAPAYMAIFYVVALIVFGKDIGPSQVGANSGTGLTGFGALFKGDVSSTGLLFWFIMIIGLMLGTQLAADSFADKMGMADAFKKKAGGWAKGFGKSAVGGFGSAGYVGRRMVGNTGTALSQNKLVQNLLTRGPLKNIGGQKLYNKIGDLKDKKVGGYSLTDAKKAREARDEKTRERLAEVRKPSSNESQADFSFRKDMEELEAYKKHLDQLGIKYTTQGQDIALKKAGKIVVGSTYTAGDDAANRKAEKDEFDRAEFEAKKLGGVVGSSMLAAVKKARTGNKGSVKGIDDQIKELAKKRESLEDASFKIIRDNFTREKEAAELALAAATANSGPGSAAELAAARTLQAKMLQLNRHTKNLDDTIRRIEQLEKDLAIANSRSSS